MKSLSELAKETDDFIDYVLSCVEAKKANPSETWLPWDAQGYAEELSAAPHLAKGYVDANEHVLLRRHIDVIELFGRKLKAHMRGGWTPPKSFGLDIVWFPRLYESNDWNNTLSDDGKTIVERNKHHPEWYKNITQHPEDAVRAVFAHKSEPTTGTLYRFEGVFKYDLQASREEKASVYKRISTRIMLDGSPQDYAAT